MTARDACPIELCVTGADAVRPLSVGQHTLWLLHALAPASAAYNQANAVRFSPVPDVAALRRAVAALLTRHDLLRSVFVETDGHPGRLVRGADLAGLDLVDVPDLDDNGLLGLAERIGSRPFRLAETGPFRVVLLRRRTDAVLVVATHHIATDALSQRLVWRDLMEAYRAARAGVEPAWPALPGSYDDYVGKERAMLDSPRRLALEQYWRGICAGAVAAELPTDRPRPEQPAYTGATVRRVLPDDLVRALHTAATGLRVTPFAVLIGAFQAVLHRHSGQRDLTIGCPTTIRRGHKLRDVVGLLVNTMVLRAEVAPTSTFADLIQAAGRQLADGVPRVGYPFARLAASRGPAEGPLFRVAITMVKPQHGDDLPEPDGGTSEFVGHRVVVLDLPQLEGQTDLSVEVTVLSNAVAVVLRYDTELFDRGTIERFGGHFQRLLAAACAEPGSRVSRAALTDDSERRRLLALGSRSAPAHIAAV